jgi:hypothetical protein
MSCCAKRNSSDKSRQDLGKRRESRSGPQRCQHMVRRGREIGARIVENARGDRAVPHKGLVVDHREKRGWSQRKDDLLLMLVEPVPEVGHPVSVFIGKRHRPYGKPPQCKSSKIARQTPFARLIKSGRGMGTPPPSALQRAGAHCASFHEHSTEGPIAPLGRISSSRWLYDPLSCRTSTVTWPPRSQSYQTWL